jgi:hypothetical protein
MIKGVVLHNNPSYLSNGKLNNIVKTHNLEKIYNQLSIIITDEEKELFDFLTPHIEWLSKYPIPTKAKDMIGGSRYQISKVRISFFELYEKLNKLMINTNSLKEHLHDYKFQG